VIKAQLYFIIDLLRRPRFYDFPQVAKSYVTFFVPKHFEGVIMGISHLKHRTTIVLPKTLKAKMIALSEKTGTPMSAIMRVALENHLAMKEAQEKQAA
jgi:hypothetical protein